MSNRLSFASVVTVLSLGCGSPQAPDRATATAGEAPIPSQGPAASAKSAPAAPTPVTTTVPVAPSASASVSAETTPPGPPAACRGARLTFEGAAELCAIAAHGRSLPEDVQAQIAGPAEVQPGAKAEFELQLVNRSTKDVSLELRLTCLPSVRALDANRRDVVRHENTGLSETLNSCSAKGTVVGIVLEPGGMLVTPFTWRARGELHRDGKLVKREPLAPGKYTLHAFTWLTRGDDASEEKQHGISVAVVGERPVVVR